MFELRVYLLSLALILLTTLLFLLPSQTFPSTKAIRKDMMACLQGDRLARHKQDCLKKLARKFVASYTTQDIETELASIESAEFKLLCHEFMHYLGQEAYNATESVLAAFSTASSFCDSGMYHGIAEEYITRNVPDGRVSAALPDLVRNGCEGFEDPTHASNGFRGLCYHGVGHGLMFLAEYDLPKALGYCDLAPETIDAESCWTGVFMENISTASFPEWSNHESKFIVSEEDITYPCRILELRYQSLCYEFQGVALQNILVLPFKEAFQACSQFPLQHREKCIFGLGANIPGAHMSTSDVAETCRSDALPLGEKVYEACIKGALARLGQFHTGETKPLIEFCSRVLENHQDLCWSEARNILLGWNPLKNMQELCSSFPQGRAREVCLTGKEVPGQIKS